MAESFKVVIDGLQSRGQHDAINVAIQRGVASHLAGLDFAGEPGQAVVLNRWLINGIIAVEGAEAIEAGLAENPTPVPWREGEVARFEVSIDGVELAEEQRGALATAIQGAVLPHIAALDFGGDRVAAALLRPPRWRGIIVRPADANMFQ